MPVFIFDIARSDFGKNIVVLMQHRAGRRYTAQAACRSSRWLPTPCRRNSYKSLFDSHHYDIDAVSAEHDLVGDTITSPD